MHTGNPDYYRLFFRCCLWAVLLIWLAVVTLVLFADQERIFAVLAHHYGLENTNILKKKLLSSQRLLQIKYSLGISFPLLCLICFFLNRKYNLLKSSVKRVGEEAKLFVKNVIKEISSLKRWQKQLLVVVGVLYTGFITYTTLRYHLQVDEVFSYVYFVSKGIGVISAYYPGPNNHIFYLQLSYLVSLITNNTLLIMRIPSLLAGLLMVVGTFLWLKKETGFLPGLLGTLLLAFSSPFIFYASHGRGYILLILFVLLALYFSTRIHQGLFYRLCFVLSCVFGFYTIPVFLYPYLVIAVWQIIFLKKTALFPFVKTHVLITALVLFLYAPVIILNGFEALTGNTWVAPMSFSMFLVSFMEWIKSLSHFLFSEGILSILLPLLLLASLILLLRKREIKWSSLLLVLVIIVPICIGIQRVLPFPRVMLFMLVFAALLFALLVKQVQEKYDKVLIIPFFILFLVMFNSLSEHLGKLSRGSEYYSELDKVTSDLFQASPEKILSMEDTYHVYLRYKFLKNSNHCSIDYQIVNSGYDYVVLPIETLWPSGLDFSLYKEDGRNTYVKIYKKKY
ncbi:MAG: hypothetical protein ACK4ND_15085 [Cytophagaceae bacterium]